MSKFTDDLAAQQAAILRKSLGIPDAPTEPVRKSPVKKGPTPYQVALDKVAHLEAALASKVSTSRSSGGKVHVHLDVVK